jgi:hypothetical protein
MSKKNKRDTMGNRIDLSDLQQTFMDNYKRMADLSLDAMKPFMEGMAEHLSTINRSISEQDFSSLTFPAIRTKSSRCCPPEPGCPPHCIANITRHAREGERIVVPFLIRNRCSAEKTYRIGVRELKDEDGNMAPSQPVLNKQSVTLAPGNSERVAMVVDLASFRRGSVYSAEIVLREEDINQNICFRLVVEGDSGPDEVSPFDEKRYKLKWQDWRSHFYCEPSGERAREERDVNQGQ